MKDDTGKPKTSRAGKPLAFVSIMTLTAEAVPDWMAFYAEVLHHFQRRRRQLEEMSSDDTRH